MVLALARGVSAQTPAMSFEELRTRVQPGDTVRVTETSGRQTTGRLDLLSAAMLQLTTGRERHAFGERTVRRVERRTRDSVRNGVLIGIAAGAAVGFAAGRVVEESPCAPGNECGQGELIGTLGGAFWGGIVGWIADAVTRTGEVVYLAPGR